VESLSHAERLARMDPGARFVTMEGVLWEPDGRVGLGSLGSDTGLISRRSELRELSKELGEVDLRIDDLAQKRQQCESEAAHLEQVQHDLRTAVYEANTRRVESQTQLTSVDETVRQLSEERPLIASEVALILPRMQETQEKESVSLETLSQLEDTSTEGERAVETLGQKIEALSADRKEVSERLTTARVRFGELSQRRSSIAEAIEALQAAQGQLRSERDKAERDVAEAHERIGQSEAQVEEARQALAHLTTEQETLSSRSGAMREEREDLRTAVEGDAVAARRLRSELEEAEGRLHECQMRLQEVRVRREDLVTRIRDELSVDLEAQHEGYEPEEEDWPAVEARIEELRGKIDRLGHVNLDAITEQSDLEERVAFLSGQLEDLRSSERQLQTLIEKLNEESEQRFTETFRAIQGHFSALFKKLFGGGRAELSLMDPNDVLECGIEIMARPPGKELQSISLLSGGEKTLTAIALLLAVMRNRPSPFVLLDEVDAALDEANNIRFNHVVQEFVKDSQFIIITHAKRTMSIADVLYGITMQEAGVSKRVSVRFEEDRRSEPAVA
jgi:chromosome segregation protein